MEKLEILTETIELIKLLDQCGESYGAGIYTGLQQEDIKLVNELKAWARELEDESQP